MSRFHRGNRDRGAALIEFALIMPLLVLLLLGTVDAGWAFFQNLEVRHGAREAARLAAVSASPYVSETDIVKAACARMNAAGDGSMTVQLEQPAGTTIGQVARVTVSRAHSSLTGLLPFFDNIALSSQVEIRLEQDASWSPTSLACDDGSIWP